MELKRKDLVGIGTVEMQRTHPRAHTSLTHTNTLPMATTTTNAGTVNSRKQNDEFMNLSAMLSLSLGLFLVETRQKLAQTLSLKRYTAVFSLPLIVLLWLAKFWVHGNVFELENGNGKC